MTEHESTVQVKNLAVSLSVFGLALVTAFPLISYFSYRDRLETLESRAFAQAEWTTETNATIMSKDMGFFSNGYKVVVKDRKRQTEMYVTPEEYLAVQVGQEICVRYKLWNGKTRAAHLCEQSIGEK